MRFGLVGGSYTAESIAAAYQQAMNLYAEKDESGFPKAPVSFYPSPGTKSFCTLGGSSVRGILENNGRVFAASGTGFYEVYSDGSTYLLGSIVGGASYVPMVAGTAQVFVIAGGSGYCLTLATNNFTPVGGLLGPVNQTTYADGYFFALNSDGSKVQFSAIDDCTSWNGLDYITPSTYSEKVVGVLADHRELWVFGNKRTQAYWNTGDASTPWQPIGSGLVEEGCAAVFSPARNDNSIFWLGKDERGAGMAWRAQGYTPGRISNHAVEQEWQTYTDISDAISYAYQLNGHQFWQLYFPTAGKTWVYDASTGLWHERGYWNVQTGYFEAHRSQCHCYAWGKHLVGDWNSGNVYEMSPAYYEDNGAVIRRVRRSPYISQENSYIYFNQLEVDVQTGLALSSGQGSDPEMIVRWSDDRGANWSNDHRLSVGLLGNYGKRCMMWRMGRCWGTYGRIYEVSMTDPIPWRITDAFLQVNV